MTTRAPTSPHPGAAAPGPTAATPASTRAAETGRRKARLLGAARTLAADGGYDAVQMRDVAAGAGVALGTLYRHYPSKDHLLLAVLADQARTLADRLASRPPDGDTPADRVAAVMRRASRALERSPRLTAAMVAPLTAPDAELAQAKQDVYEIMRSIIAVAIDGRTGPERDGLVVGATVPELDAVVRTLGYVWLAVLSAWMGGLLPADAMAADLDAAGRLLLDGRT